MSYLKLETKILNSYFYRFILNPNDKILLQTLLLSIIHDKRYYKNRLLVVNSKYKTLANLSGESIPSVRRSLDKLSNLGVVIKIKRTSRTTQYLVGFRTLSNDRVYLIEHHILEYDKWIKRIINHQLKDDEFKKIKFDHSMFAMDIEHVKFIKANINNPQTLLNVKTVINDTNPQTITEILFNRDDLKTKILEPTADVIKLYT